MNQQPMAEHRSGMEQWDGFELNADDFPPHGIAELSRNLSR